MKSKRRSTGHGLLRRETDPEAFLIAPNPPLMALIERAMSEPGDIPLAKVEREIADRTRELRPRR